MFTVKAQWPSWRLVKRVGLAILLALLAYLLFFWRLVSLTPGLSETEKASLQASSSLQKIYQNPIYAPHKLIQYLVQLSGQHGSFGLRAVSAVYALVFLFCLYRLLTAWFGRFVALLGCLLLGATPLFILASRSAAPTILLLLPLTLLVGFVWLSKTTKWPNLAWICVAFLAAITTYVPAGVWLIIMGLIFGRKLLIGRIERVTQPSLIAGVALYFVTISPIIIASIDHPSVARQLILVPNNWPGIVDFFKNIGGGVSALLWKPRVHYDLVIARTPVLSATQIVLFSLGVYALIRRARRETYFLLGVIAIAIIGIGLGQNTSFLVLSLTAISILAAAGLRFLHFEWQSVFPRNPLPRLLAAALLLFLVGLQLLYGSRYSLEAWPHTSETKMTYVLK